MSTPLSESQSQELVRADLQPPAPDPNYGPGHLFAKGNSAGGGRGKQRIAGEIFNRALAVMEGAEPQEGDEKNCLIHLIRDMTDPKLDRDLQQKAALGLCKFIIGTRSNVSLDLPEQDGEEDAGVRRMKIALALVRE